MRRVVILGLTGSIGMGKSTVARQFAAEGTVPFDADAAVHELLEPGGRAVGPVAAVFPGVARGEGRRRWIDRAALGARVFGDPAATARLEAIVHPLVRACEARFLRRAAARRVALVVLDIPLLFETGGERRCDAVVVVTAPRFVQRRRVLSRPGMTPARLAAIQARQMPDHEKRKRADFIVPTGLGMATSLQAVRRVVRIVSRWRGRHWPPPAHWQR